MLRRLALLLPLLAACATPADPPRTVARVDLARYLGTWYEVARLPNRFEDADCRDITAEYGLRPDGRIGVVNTCRKPDGRVDRAEGSAYAVEGTNNSRLRVSFFWPFYGDYWVIGLDPDYRWAVVGAPGRDYLWVLSRTPVLPPAEYEAALGVARREGFDLNKLILPAQSATSHADAGRVARDGGA
ncbi:lipocalin family protein [Roseomonas sp. NAR14]|uniref:Outer membrane lipoprotein Blc n=1 Tax=Roseomonas acroporae TaxID=2937791 RepID=A0A9X1Y7F5_9PROT|nr:lipocalin family protein [Roseomonas acroporae]MCK8784477.1 lipocalin family protein [Roseomonas acroporae]